MEGVTEWVTSNLAALRDGQAPDYECDLLPFPADGAAAGWDGLGLGQWGGGVGYCT